MRRYFGAFMLLFGAVLVLANCDSPDRISSPAAAPQREVQAGPALADDDGSDVTATPSSSAVVADQVSRTIGPQGGWLVMQGRAHKVWVAPGAVTRPTLFTLTRIPSDLVMVELTAQQVIDGKVVQVGVNGFAQPITLMLSYDGTKLNARQNLTIVQVGSDGSSVKLPSTISQATMQAVAQVKFRSRYAICAD